jgi:hypothetical protein
MYALILYGRYKNQVIELDDATGAAAVADKWGIDTANTPYPYEGVEFGDELTEVPQSYTDWTATLDAPPEEGGGDGGDGGNGGGGDVAPTLDSITPASAPIQSGDVTATIAGSGFTASSVVVWNGIDDTSTFVDENTITTVVKTDMAGAPSTVTVAVRNGAESSGEISFEFTEAPAPEE